MKPIFLRDAEAEAWKPGEVVLWREITKQPPVGHIFTGYVLDTTGNRRKIGMVAWHCGGVTCHQGFYVRPPFHPGDMLAVKETWSSVIRDVNADTWRIIFKSDKKQTHPWYSPATMPFHAVRHFATVKAVDAVERDGKWFWKITLEATQ